MPDETTRSDGNAPASTNLDEQWSPRELVLGEQPGVAPQYRSSDDGSTHLPSVSVELRSPASSGASVS